MLSVVLLAMCSTCSALVVGAVPASPLTAASSASRSCTPMLKRSAEERDMIELEGTVLESMRGANFRVQLDETDQVIMVPASRPYRRTLDSRLAFKPRARSGDHGVRLGKDSQELHQGPRGRQGHLRALSVRSDQGAHHVPQEIGARLSSCSCMSLWMEQPDTQPCGHLPALLGFACWTPAPGVPQICDHVAHSLSSLLRSRCVCVFLCAEGRCRRALLNAGCVYAV